MAKKPAKKPAGKPAANGAKDKAFKESEKDLDGAWEKSREVDPAARTFSRVNENVPDGDYALQVESAKYGDPKDKSKPGYFTINYVILYGQLAGEKVQSYDSVSTEAVGTTGRTKMDLLSERLQLCGVATKKIEHVTGPKNDLPKVAKWLTDNKPVLRAKVANSEKDPKPGTTEKQRFQNVYISGVVDKSELKDLEKQFS